VPHPASNRGYDAVLLVSFGGPNGPDDVIPFLRNVTRGRDVPAERLAAVAHTYERFDGRSPINDHNRSLRDALQAELSRAGHDLPVYWGNRNWHPFLRDAVAHMAADGVRTALAFVTSAFSSYSSCRQYLDDLAGARAEVGPDAPRIDKVRPYFNHPGFVASWTKSVGAAFARLPAERRSTERRSGARLIFTAHSIPRAMAACCDYEAQLRETARLVAASWPQVGWELAWQSRSGPPSVPWLEPDVGERLAVLPAEGVDTVVLAPLGFVSDHMEVVYDLDVVAAQRAEALGLRLVRAATPGTDPRFVAMARELVEEGLEGLEGRRPVSLGRLPPCPMRCPDGCCPPVR
jgi:protoporphyrin/coproporphyrin ferrochelatase